MPLRATIKDDRGRRVPLAPIPAGIVGRALDRRVRERFGTAPLDMSAAQYAWFALAGLPVVVLLGLMPVALTSWLKAPPWVTFPAVLATAAVPALVTIFLGRRIAGRNIAARFRQIGACASCGYELEGIQPEPDGCRVCPECGAAWKMKTGDPET